MKAKLTKLEAFVMAHEAESFDSLATQLNRTPAAIERAYERALAKLRAPAPAPQAPQAPPPERYRGILPSEGAQAILDALADDDTAARIGAALVTNLDLKPLPPEPDWPERRYWTEWGTKTARGLARSIVYLVQKQLH